MLEVLGEVHRGHAAPAELAFNAVAVGEGGCKALRNDLAYRTLRRLYSSDERNQVVEPVGGQLLERGKDGVLYLR